MGALTANHPLIAIPAAIAAALLAWQIIWKRGIKPLIRLGQSIIRIAEATPVLVQIAEEFQPNGGGSLRDTVDRIETSTVEAVKIGTENQVALAESLPVFAKHLEQVAWHTERADVMARLSLIERRQEAIRVGITRTLVPIMDAPGSIGTIVRQVLEIFDQVDGHLEEPVD